MKREPGGGGVPQQLRNSAVTCGYGLGNIHEKMHFSHSPQKSAASLHSLNIHIDKTGFHKKHIVDRKGA